LGLSSFFSAAKHGITTDKSRKAGTIHFTGTSGQGGLSCGRSISLGRPPLAGP
jgi:hypothetical protein